MTTAKHPYEEGYEATMQNGGAVACPYSKRDKGYISFLDGVDDAFDILPAL